MAKILIVDHMNDDRTMAQKTLEKAGHDVLLTDNGADCVTLASFKQPDLILMEEDVPGINGYQATKQLNKRSKTADIPVIILSNKNQKTDQIWCLKQGAADYLIKPFNEKTLLNRVNTALENSARSALVLS